VADIVFADAQALADLGAIVHPAVGAEIARRLGEEAGTDHVVVLDVPLLVESGRDDLAALVVVDVDPEVAVQRLVAQRGMREDDARARMARQARREDRLAKADVVIDNSGTRDDLAAVVDAVWPTLLALGAARVDGR
jgi:dephospho-CoA kinase